MTICMWAFGIGPVNDTETGSCDNSTESGDCGYRNTGCGTGPFEVSLTSDSSDSQHGHEPIVPLMNDQASSSECPIFVCLPCLQKSGFSVSLRNKSETSPSSRKKRSFIKGKYQFVSVLFQYISNTC